MNPDKGANFEAERHDGVFPARVTTTGTTVTQHVDVNMDYASRYKLMAPYLKKLFIASLTLSGEPESYDLFVRQDKNERLISDNETVVSLYQYFQKGLFKILPRG